MRRFTTYILKSLKDGKYYYGSCSDIDIRLQNHNTGKVRSTKSRKPFIVHYKEEFEQKTDALKREKFFKTINGYIWLKEQKII